jgi:hypothetical protein
MSWKKLDIIEVVKSLLSYGCFFLLKKMKKRESSVLTEHLEVCIIFSYSKCSIFSKAE